MKKNLEPRSWSKKNHKDKNKQLEDEIKSLKAQIRAKDKIIRNLKSEVGTLEVAWDKTKDYLSEITEDRALKEVIDTAAAERPLKKEKKDQKICPRCYDTDLATIKFNGFKVESCGNKKCGYRKKIND